MESDGSQSLQVSGSQSFKVRGSVQFMPLKPGENGTIENATIVNGGCSTFGRVWEGNTTHHGVTQTNSPRSGSSFFWTDGIRVASCFFIPRGTSGVLCSNLGKYEFQVWTLQSELVGIIKVTTSESREQAELAHRAVQKICNTEERERLVQNTNLEVMYSRGTLLINDGSRKETEEVESLNDTKGIYVWIHDGKLIVDGTRLTEELREIFRIKQIEQQRMKEKAEMAERVAQFMRRWQHFSGVNTGNR